MCFVYILLEGIYSLGVFIKVGYLPEVGQVVEDVYDVRFEVADEVKYKRVDFFVFVWDVLVI